VRHSSSTVSFLAPSLGLQVPAIPEEHFGLPVRDILVEEKTVIFPRFYRAVALRCATGKVPLAKSETACNNQAMLRTAYATRFALKALQPPQMATLLRRVQLQKNWREVRKIWSSF
jgi:hypothetical protein